MSIKNILQLKVFCAANLVELSRLELAEIAGGFAVSFKHASALPTEQRGQPPFFSVFYGAIFSIIRSAKVLKILSCAPDTFALLCKSIENPPALRNSE